MRLRKEYGSSTRPSPPALPPIGQRTGSASGCSRNIAPAQALSHFAAMTDGKSLWWEADSLMQLNPGMPLLKARL